MPADKNAGAWSNDRLAVIGKAAGITAPEFVECVKKGDYLGWVANSASAGAQADINSTPTVFINGKEINRDGEYFDIAKFRAAVERG